MKLNDTPIQQKLMTVIMITSGAVLFLTCTAFFAYEFFTFRRTTLRELSTLGEIIATNSTAALAFDDRKEAAEILTALKAEKHIEAAGLYDKNGNLFSTYPDSLPISNFPQHPGDWTYRFEESNVSGFQPVIQAEKKLGTLYLKSNLKAINERFQLYAGIMVLVILLSFLLAYILSKWLQQGISKPILMLAATAKAISVKQDYSVRAQKLGNDELGFLTSAFNQMLAQIQKQNVDLIESEERVRAVLNSALSAVIVMDANGIITDWNLRAEKMFGLTSEEAIGMELAEAIIPSNYRDAHRKGLNHFMMTGKGPVINQFLEMSALRHDGTEFPVELSISVLKANDVITFCGFVTDITERKKAEEEIKMFNQKLEQMVSDRTQELEIVNKELESFSYSVSHDLRAPLRSIHGYVNIFVEEYSNKFDDEAKRLTTIIMNNTQKMGRLIDNLLAFSQLGRKELTKTQTSMKNIVENVWEEHRRLEGNKNIKCEILELPDAYVDTITIRQVWINLISNAIKYSRQKESPRIEIGAEEQEDMVIYHIRDNGAGFDMLYYDKLFGVFQRLHSQKEFEGTGVGLAIVQRIITKHGGRVWAEAKLNEGATFYFSVRKS